MSQTTTTPPNGANFLKWAGAFTILAVVASIASETSAGQFVTPLLWLATTGAVVYWWKPLSDNLSNLSGTKLA